MAHETVGENPLPHADSPIICAIDTTDTEHARELIAAVYPYVGAVKIGLEFFVANGARGVELLSDHHIPIFLDLKFHDIPNTVARAIEATAGIDTFMMTVHTAGGRAMLQGAIDASMHVAEMTGKERPLIVGVTVLTSMDQMDLEMIGMSHRLDAQVTRLADLAQSAQLDGVVCSPYEITMLREACGEDLVLVVPGIRPESANKDDQKRTLTPKEAMERGADYLVIGRPITAAADPASAAKEIYLSVME